MIQKVPVAGLNHGLHRAAGGNEVVDSSRAFRKGAWRHGVRLIAARLCEDAPQVMIVLCQDPRVTFHGGSPLVKCHIVRQLMAYKSREFASACHGVWDGRFLFGVWPIPCTFQHFFAHFRPFSYVLQAFCSLQSQ